jgi:hypothetical protein
MYQHKHIYVYEYLLRRKLPDRGYERCIYTLLTDITGPNNSKNKQLVEQGLRIAYGFKPMMIRYQHEQYQTK